ncbi:MAG: hypothetical protein H7Z13_10490 [Ferruginibacter sp.]|nr:hypothetical protein [Ferruginibacter sp.]
MKRTFTYIIAALAAVALFAVIVHFVLVAANVSKPAATTVYGLTARRIWALTYMVLALISVVIGWRTLRQSAKGINILKGKKWVIVAIVAGMLAVINAVLNLATANGGPGTGNGVLGSAQALLLGLIGIILAGIAAARFRRKNLES